MKKTLTVFLIAIVMILFVGSSSLALGKKTEISIILNGHKLALDTQPKVINGRIMVPLRNIFETLGADVYWDGENRTVTANRDGIKIVITVNQKKAYKNGQVINLDSAPIIISKRVLVPLRFVSEAFGHNVHWEEQTRTVYIKNNLPVVGSQANLIKLLNEAERNQSYMELGIRKTKAAESVTMDASASLEAKNDYSATNIQVEGVDEADLVKTDGEYIYQVNEQRIVVAKAFPAETMKIASVINFEDEFRPLELYVDDKYLIVIGSAYNENSLLKAKSLKPQIYPPYYREGTTKAVIYNLSNKANLTKLREIELEGDYVSSRKIGSALYLIANKNINYYHIMEQDAANFTPGYRDSAKQDGFVSINYGDIHYFPGSIVPNYLIIAGLDLAKQNEDANISTYLGAGQNIYASQENLYIAVTEFKPVSTTNTLIYKFGLQKGQVDFQVSGEVPGRVLNQFSMDEHNKNFRIVTTVGDVWRTDEGTSKNNVYILDHKLKTIGKLENIAPGEQVYSVRFLGERGYVVTFKTVDPLFVIDLKNPHKPQILGALKIPGYSDYLHPYDENHIIGFGKDTEEVSQKDWQGNAADSIALYQGMKIALFDVTDVSKPIEKYKEIIGGRGTDSELLRNHKALLFAKDKNLLAFPVTVMEVKDRSPGAFQYGEFTFQGAYVYNLDMEHGFQLRGRITHLTGEDYQKAGYNWYGSKNNVERIIYIENKLYTLSRGMIKAHDILSLKEVNSITIPSKEAD